MRRFILLISAWLVLVLPLAACAPWPDPATPAPVPPARATATGPAATPTPVPQYGGEVTIGVVGELRDLNPALDGGALAAALLRPAVEGLFSFDGQGKPQPWLAESVPSAGRGISDDGRVVIIRLRQGVAWEDGRPLVAADLAFSHAVASDPANALPPEVEAANAAIRQLDVLDSFTARLAYDGPTDSFLHAFPTIFPAHLFNGRTGLAGHPYARAPFGTGPFRFSEWVPGDHLTLARSESFRESGRPYLDRIIYRQFPDPASAQAAREVGAIDLILAPDLATFVAPLPAHLRGLGPYQGAPPTRTAAGWWRDD